MRRTPRMGLTALMEASRTTPEAVTARDLGYRIGPRINAAGRLDDATRGYRVLIGDEPSVVQSLAQRVEEQNAQRRAIQAQMTDEARAQASSPTVWPMMDSSLPAPTGIPESLVLLHRVWSRSSEPSILLAEDGGVLKGSARSVSGLNIKAALDLCEPLLMKYGGHPAAAGMTLRPELLPDFRQALNDAARTLRTDDAGPIPLDVDAELNLEEVDRRFIVALEDLAPYGQGNAAPVFLSRGLMGRARLLN